MTKHSEVRALEQTAQVKEYLLENAEELKSVVNELNSWDNSFDHLIAHENDEEFFNTYFDGNPMEAVRAVSFGEYNFNDEMVQFNGYGNLVSLSETDFEEVLAGEIDEIVECLIFKQSYLSLSDELEELLADEEEDEDEE